jgi:prepilin-type N-terminal cleavage/methylation domain-containing protein
MHTTFLRRNGFTLVELLVVILLPAIQAARESARRSQCTNHLKNLAEAALLHHDVAKHFPTGGWGWWWVGDPDRGFGRKQPGGWAFNLMPFTEEGTAYKLASDGQSTVHTPQQLDGIREVVTKPLVLLNCPSRRPGLVLPKTEAGPSGVNSIAYNCSPNPTSSNVAGRTDYAINCRRGAEQSPRAARRLDLQLVSLSDRQGPGQQLQRPGHRHQLSAERSGRAARHRWHIENVLDRRKVHESAALRDGPGSRR